MYEPRLEPLEAPPYVVTCWEVDRAAGDGHEHVVAVRSRDPDGGQTRWATVEVISAVREGVSFVADDEEGTSLEPSICPECATVTLAVAPGSAPIDLCD